MTHKLLFFFAWQTLLCNFSSLCFLSFSQHLTVFCMIKFIVFKLKIKELFLLSVLVLESLGTHA